MTAMYPDELVAAVTLDVLRELRTFGYNPDQPRDTGGKFGEGGGSSSDSHLGNDGFVSKAEFDQTKAQRDEKIRNCPVPSPEQVAKNREMIARSGRRGGDFRGNNTDRKRNTAKLLKEFGDGTHAPCVWCGEKMDAEALTQDKIYTGHEGGRYTYPNLLPSCMGCNRSRSDTPIAVHLAQTASVWQLDWDEDAHPRGHGGRFGSGGTVESANDGSAEKLVYADGSHVYAHKLDPNLYVSPETDPSRMPGQINKTETKLETYYNKLQGTYNNKITPASRKAIRVYANDDGYMPVNDYLRTGKGWKPSEEDLEEGFTEDRVKGMVKDMDKALGAGAKAQTTGFDPAHPLVLYRGLSSTMSKDVENLKPGDLIRDPAFVSTSFSRDVAKGDFAGPVMAIHPSSNTRALSVDPILGRQSQVEHEVILGRNTPLVYAGKNDQGDHVFVATDKY